MYRLCHIDQNSHNLIIQFTGIYSLGSGYGPSDFRELLALSSESQTFIRPTKISNHLWSVAEEVYEHDKSAGRLELEDMLQDLNWTRDETAENSNWELGLSKNGHLIACKLSNSSQQ